MTVDVIGWRIMYAWPCQRRCLLIGSANFALIQHVRFNLSALSKSIATRLEFTSSYYEGDAVCSR